MRCETIAAVAEETVDEWDELASSWDTDAGPRTYAAAAFASLVGLLDGDGPPLAGARVLDFGCGTGLLTEHLLEAGATVVAVDTSAGMLEVLDAKVARLGWRGVSTSTVLPGPSIRFDLVVCSSVFSFLDDHPTAVAELASRLAPGGRLVQWDWERADDDDHGLTRAEIGDALTGAGLTAVEVRPAFTIEVDGQSMTPLLGHGRARGRPRDGSRRDSPR